jgi:ribosomal protein RSM22 (predicted rRNA methylase)
MTQDQLRCLEPFFQTLPWHRIQEGQKHLSKNYRDKKSSSSVFATEEGRLAYLATRCPATFAAVCRVLEELRRRLPTFYPRTALDIGAGFGTASWALLSTFATLEKIELIEKEIQAVLWGQRIPFTGMDKAIWRIEDIDRIKTFPAVDVLIASYTLGEWSRSTLEATLDRLIQSPIAVALFLEPGTPEGFTTLLEVRTRYLKGGWSLVAPCPHAMTCPWQGTQEWCHFSVRLPRTSLHRYVKGAERGFEDEKWFYQIFAREPWASFVPFEGRLVQRVRRYPGRVALSICDRRGFVSSLTLSKKDPRYRSSKKLAWGDAVCYDLEKMG